jgi:2-hydroxy-3-keto-5-methylthiopentenyl-1-phosphate phosphatase
MKKLTLTKKVPEYSAYLWDGTVESYQTLVPLLKDRARMEFHMNDTYSWISAEDLSLFLSGGMNKFKNVFENQYLVFADKGLEVLTKDEIDRRFDVIDEFCSGGTKKSKAKAWSNKCVTWNKSIMMGDLND